jgi:fatty acid/phospholipid biosynthesis enzyme
MAATAPDYSSLSSAVDFSGVTPMIISAGAAGITMLLAFVAVKYVRRIVRSA